MKLPRALHCRQFKKKTVAAHSLGRFHIAVKERRWMRVRHISSPENGLQNTAINSQKSVTTDLIPRKTRNSQTEGSHRSAIISQTPFDLNSKRKSKDFTP
jgi:hypothetical protein